jgi:DNA uptake protein ComE-like DNA-binding protein
MTNIDSESWFRTTPQWVYYSFVPFLGGGSLIWAGIKAKVYAWLGIGIGLIVGSFVISNTPLADLFWLIWGGQIVTAFALKQEFLVRTYPSHLPLPSDHKLAQRVGLLRGKLDINTCSKDELVRIGLPIVYVNDIFVLRESGHIFTDVAELGEIIGIPDQALQRIAPLITFSYNPRQEAFTSWRRANSFSAQQLIQVGLTPEVAQKLIAGRETGAYKSIVDITKRTGLPLEALRELL